MRVGQIYRQKMAQEVVEGVKKQQTAILVTYSKVSSSKMTNLRKDLKRKKADMLVSRTSILNVALKQAEFESLANSLKGQMALILSDADASEVSKVVVKFAKDTEGFILAGGILNGAVLSGAQIQTLSDLPSREVLLSKFMGTLQAPLTRFAGALNAKTRDFMSICKQKSEKGGN